MRVLGHTLLCTGTMQEVFHILGTFFSLKERLKGCWKTAESSPHMLSVLWDWCCLAHFVWSLESFLSTLQEAVVGLGGQCSVVGEWRGGHYAGFPFLNWTKQCRYPVGQHAGISETGITVCPALPSHLFYTDVDLAWWCGRMMNDDTTFLPWTGCEKGVWEKER